MAVDPARIRRNMQEAERSQRVGLGEQDAEAVLKVLAVVMDEGLREDERRGAVALRAAG
ncbi:hypothetical protein ACFYWS_20355 [Streptomyces sp. NPDC002795]|uniref:hypothetical protein n=1 Tax=Streptomyces sp. NPDC002795 TaxID=3364665 RepID=UPI0036C5B911